MSKEYQLFSIRDFDKKWYASELSSVLHPTVFEENKFLSWWFAHFDDTRDLYHVYVLSLITHF